MLILNFAHPLTDEHLAQVEDLIGREVDRVIDLPVYVDDGFPLDEQISELIDAAGLSAIEWQTEPILVNPPGYAPAAAALLAELHGRMGHFPTILWMVEAPDSIPQQWRVAQIVNLQALRRRARQRR